MLALGYDGCQSSYGGRVEPPIPIRSSPLQESIGCNNFDYVGTNSKG